MCVSKVSPCKYFCVDLTVVVAVILAAVLFVVTMCSLFYETECFSISPNIGIITLSSNYCPREKSNNQP